MTANSGQKFMGLAAALGLAAAVAGYYGLNSAASSAAARARSQYRDVVVTSADLTYGVKLERSMLQVAHYPKDAIPMGAYSSIDSVVGQTTKVFMGTKEPITATKLSSRGGGLSMLVHPDMRAASIEVNQVSGVSGFVLPGDRVDVLITIEPRNASDNAVTQTLLQNIEVLAAGQKTQPKDGNPITVQSVTLLVDPQGAEVLAHASHEGEIHLVLRNPDDQKQVAVTSFSTRQMLGGQAEKPAPAPAPRRSSAPAAPVVIMEPARTPAPPPEPAKVRIIRNSQVQEIPGIRDSSGR